MKSCPYCGKEYPDDVNVCSIDGEALWGNEANLSPSSEQPADPLPDKEGSAAKDRSYLTFPEYQWSARDAWKCVAMIFVFGLILALVERVLGLQFRSFWSSGFGYFSGDLLHYAVSLLVAAYFARTETLASFWKGFGLDRKPSELAWFGVAAALVIRAFGHFMLTHRWGKGVSNFDLTAFRDTVGFERFFFLAPGLILAPLFEEATYRGFLYKAFRGSYPILVSMILLVAWAANTHWRYYSHSWIAALDLSLLTVVQCYLREKSDSLWDCILCHFAYNASVLFVTDALR